MKRNYHVPFFVLILLIGVNSAFAQSKLSSSPFNAIVTQYLQTEKGALGLNDIDVADLYIANEVFSKKSQITHLYIVQRYQGVEIFNAISSVAIKDGKVHYFANNFIGDIAQKINSSIPSITPIVAIQKVSAHFGLGSVGNLTEVSSRENKHEFSPGNISNSNIPVQLVYHFNAEENQMTLAWDLSIDQLDGQHWRSVRVNALTGEIIDSNDWVSSCGFGDIHNEIEHNNSPLFHHQMSPMFADGSQYNVFPFPIESPNHGPRALLTEPSNDSASPYGWHDTDAANGAEHTITRGNNVWAQDDIDGNNGTTGYSPDGTAALNFNFALDLNVEASNYLDASLTNLFYVNNIMHDVWYQYGFDEASGNFQQNNYGNGGLGNDYVVAQGQDGSSTDNANFATPPDGNNPRMQMYMWGPYSLPQPLTINNSALAGSYTASYPASDAANNITAPSSTPVTANLALALDGAAAPNEACNALVNGANVSGKIAVIKRGNCDFVVKIQNAQNAGAVAVIMVNHNNPTNDPTYTEYVNMAGLVNPPFTIPSIFVNYADGQQIIDALTNGQTINATIANNGPYPNDGSFDNGIVAHEYGHGISTRLTGGPGTSNCLNNGEQMGEGWSDWFALMLTLKSGDQPGDIRGIATFASGQEIDEVGIRPVPYSTDFAVNDYTYAATNDDTIIGTIDGEPVAWNEITHNIGFVWATILWDLNWAYIEKYGFDPDLYNGTGGNNRAMQIVIDGLKLQPCNPGFVDGRNAILSADMALTGGEDQCLIWEVFANRGVGFNAAEGANPFSSSMTDQVEDFTLPPNDHPSLDNCTFLSVNENKLNEYQIYPNPASNEINIKVNKYFGDVQVSMFDINGRKIFSQVVTLENTVKVNIENLQSGMYIMNIAGEEINVNEKIIIK